MRKHPMSHITIDSECLARDNWLVNDAEVFWVARALPPDSSDLQWRDCLVVRLKTARRSQILDAAIPQQRTASRSNLQEILTHHAI
jgi:hypothetical protein